MQKLTAPSGDTLIVLTQAEYDDLLEKADMATALRVEADIAAGRDERVPDDIAKRLLDGESPVKIWRAFRGLTGRDLAAQAGISAPYLCEIECGKKEGSLSAMKKIADVLQVDLDDLV